MKPTRGHSDTNSGNIMTGNEQNKMLQKKKHDTAAAKTAMEQETKAMLTTIQNSGTGRSYYEEQNFAQSEEAIDRANARKKGQGDARRGRDFCSLKCLSHG